MKRLTIILAAAALAALNAAAVEIDGAITFDGSATLNNGNNILTATQVSTFSNVKVETADGDFDTFVNPNDAVTMASPWIFNPSTATPGLWSVGGFTFDLDSSSVNFQGSFMGQGFLLVSGTGTVSGNSFEPTPGSWSFTTQTPSAGGKFSFSAGTEAHPTPDGGNTLVLLGVCMTGLAFARRRITA